MTLTIRCLSAFAALLVPVCCLAQNAPPAEKESAPIDFSIGGCGGAYFLAEPGELTIELEKRDRNRRMGTELRAILVGPDRAVLQEVSIPDDGQPARSGMGPVQRVKLSVPVARKGIYALNITVSQDRYGDEVLWGFATNCPKYLIETSRGHRDQRREEPIVLGRPDQPGDVCFLPRRGEFAVEATGLAESVKELSVYDGQGRLVQTIAVESGGQVSHTFPAGDRGAGPWRLHLPSAQAIIQIDGVTRWDEGDAYPNLPYWSPKAESFFPWHDFRWLVTPYSRTLYGEPGRQAIARFEVHNNSEQKRTIDLALEFPGASWPARLSAQQVELRAKQSREVTVEGEFPTAGESMVCHVRATPRENAEFSTYSTVTLIGGESPARRPLEIPLVLKPYRHENEQFGYAPDYPLDGAMYFDPENRPHIIGDDGVVTWRDGAWKGPQDRTFSVASTKVAFDRDGRVYALGRADRRSALLYSTDAGRTFSAAVLPGEPRRGQSFDIEQFSGHNIPDGPPPILRYTQTASDPKRIWRRFNDLELLLPQWTDGGVEFVEPVLISKKCIGLSLHSGAPSTVVSRGAKVHVVFAEATEPEEKVPGVPTYVVTYDRQAGKLGEPALVGYGAPPNDIHNTPSITIDSRGYLHALAGTHGRPFQYARSLESNDAGRGWTEAVPVGEDLEQTYIGLVCGPDDSLHLTYRLWQRNKEPFPLSHYATLAYQRKPADKPWESPRVLIVPPFSEYSVFYHRLTIDQRGRLFLSYDYWSTYWFYRTDHRGNRRALMMSPDGGQTWKLADNGDLIR